MKKIFEFFSLLTKKLLSKKPDFSKLSLRSLSEEQKKELLKNSLFVALFLVVSIGMVTALDLLLSPRINENSDRKVLAAMQRVLPADEYIQSEFDFSINDGVIVAYEAQEDGLFSGYCVLTVSQGHNGEVYLVTGISADNKISAVEIISMAETQGSGAAIATDGFLSGFKGKEGTLSGVRTTPKLPGHISVISGATVSSNAVVDGVNRATEAVSVLRAEKEKSAAEASASSTEVNAE